MDILKLCASIKAHVAKGHSYLDDQVIGKVVDLADRCDDIVRGELQRRVLLQHLHTLQQQGMFNPDSDDADSTVAGSKANLLEAMVEPDGVDARLFVLVEDGESGITTRVFLSRPGAERALLKAALDYRRDGEPIHSEDSIKAAIAQMREAAAGGEHPVIECGDQGTLWIDTVELEG